MKKGIYAIMALVLVLASSSAVYAQDKSSGKKEVTQRRTIDQLKAKRDEQQKAIKDTQQAQLAAEADADKLALIAFLRTQKVLSADADNTKVMATMLSGKEFKELIAGNIKDGYVSGVADVFQRFGFGALNTDLSYKVLNGVKFAMPLKLASGTAYYTFSKIGEDEYMHKFVRLTPSDTTYKYSFASGSGATFDVNCTYNYKYKDQTKIELEQVNEIKYSEYEAQTSGELADMDSTPRAEAVCTKWFSFNLDYKK